MTRAERRAAEIAGAREVAEHRVLMHQFRADASVLAWERFNVERAELAAQRQAIGDMISTEYQRAVAEARVIESVLGASRVLEPPRCDACGWNLNEGHAPNCDEAEDIDQMDPTECPGPLGEASTETRWADTDPVQAAGAVQSESVALPPGVSAKAHGQGYVPPHTATVLEAADSLVAQLDEGCVPAGWEVALYKRRRSNIFPPLGEIKLERSIDHACCAACGDPAAHGLTRKGDGVALCGSCAEPEPRGRLMSVEKRAWVEAQVAARPGWSQRRLAALCGVGKTTIQNIQRGE